MGFVHVLHSRHEIWQRQASSYPPIPSVSEETCLQAYLPSGTWDMTEITNLLARNLTTISNERNQVERLAAVQELWAQHGVMMVDDGTYVGHLEIK